MLKRYWFLCATLAGALAAFFVTLMLASARPALISRFPVSEAAGALDAPPLRADPASGPAATPRSAHSRFPRQLEWLTAALVGAVVAGVIVVAAIIVTGEASSEGATPCEKFAQAHALVSGVAPANGAPSPAERILSDADDSTRVKQLRAMFDTCYNWAKR